MGAGKVRSNLGIEEPGAPSELMATTRHPKEADATRLVHGCISRRALTELDEAGYEAPRLLALPGKSKFWT